MKYKKLSIITSVLIIAAIIIIDLCCFGKKENKKISSNLSNAMSIGAATPEETLFQVAKAIKTGNTTEALKIFDKGSHSKISDLITRLDPSGKIDLAERIAKAKVIESSDRRITYEMPSYQYTRTEEGKIQVEERTVHFYMIKLSNGNWVIEDL